MLNLFRKSMIITVMCLFTNAILAVPFYHNNELINFQKTNSEYNLIRVNLDKCIYFLENENENEALSKINKLDDDANNFGGIFVIDPATGKILTSPELKDKNIKGIVPTDKINGKALSREAIANWQKRRIQGFWDDIMDVLTVKHLNFFTDIAVTQKGKVYVIAIGKNDINLQRMFVEKVVKYACRILKESGPKDAYEIFNQKDSKFRYNSKSYIYVYSDTGICLYNPNYPELEGKNAAKTDLATKQMVELAKTQGSGWLECDARIPGENKEGKKEIYFQSVFLDGKTFIVGSGIYVNSNK